MTVGLFSRQPNRVRAPWGDGRPCEEFLGLPTSLSAAFHLTAALYGVLTASRLAMRRGVSTRTGHGLLMAFAATTIIAGWTVCVAGATSIRTAKAAGSCPGFLPTRYCHKLKALRSCLLRWEPYTVRSAIGNGGPATDVTKRYPARASKRLIMELPAGHQRGRPIHDGVASRYAC